jgi:deoxyribonuclease IV
MAADAQVGAHVGGEKPLGAARELGADCVQIFLSDPQSWHKPPDRSDADELRTSGVPIYVHAPYLINVCSPKPNVRYGSRKILQQTCDAASAIGAAAVVVHGGHAEDDIAEGPGRWVRSLELLETDVLLLIENTAGGENAVARRFDALAALWEALSGNGGGIDLGFCFDTCHAHAAGEDLSDVAERAVAITGGIDLLHANDSRDAAGSGADRHANLGSGEIGADVLRAMIAAAGSPAIVETPGPDDALRADIDFVRAALGG